MTDTSTVVTSVEQLKGLIGQETRVGDWHTVTQEEINAFAEATGDHQWIHVDPERAKNGPFGGTIAHGFLSLSLLSRMGAEVLLAPEGVRMALNYGLDRVRFLAPVRSGKRVRGRFTLDSVEERAPGQWLFSYQVTVEIEGEEKPALTAAWLGLILT